MYISKRPMYAHSLSGKWTRSWVLDNPLIRKQAKDWMIQRVKTGAKDGCGVFCISDFQCYLNTELLPAWEIPKSTLPRRARHDDTVATSEFLQVSWSTARSWALAIGAKFKAHKKGYYVDGHDRSDVLEHRSLWLRKELELELRQYLWVQLTLDQATKLNVPGYRTPGPPPAKEQSPPVSSNTIKPTKRRFQRPRHTPVL